MNTSQAEWPDRKAHASLAQIEDRLLEGLREANLSLGENCNCVALEHALADEYQAQPTAAELTAS